MVIFIYFFQMTSNDKDFRFMATNDLMVELQKDSIKLDDDSERKVFIFVPQSRASHSWDSQVANVIRITAYDFLYFSRDYIFSDYLFSFQFTFLQVVKMLLKLLEDKNGEVQNLAVKWWV